MYSRRIRRAGTFGWWSCWYFWCGPGMRPSNWEGPCEEDSSEGVRCKIWSRLVWSRASKCSVKDVSDRALTWMLFHYHSNLQVGPSTQYVILRCYSFDGLSTSLFLWRGVNLDSRELYLVFLHKILVVSSYLSFTHISNFVSTFLRIPFIQGQSYQQQEKANWELSPRAKPINPGLWDVLMFSSIMVSWFWLSTKFLLRYSFFLDDV